MLLSMVTLQENSVLKSGYDLCLSISSRNTRKICLQIKELPTNLERYRDIRKEKTSVKKWTALGLDNIQSFFSSYSWLSFGRKNSHIKGQVLYLLRSMAGCPLISVNSESCFIFPQLRTA